MLGQRVRRREDSHFLTGNGQYVDDLKLPGARPATYVRSDWAHARILGIDALAHLGVRHLDMPVNGERVWRAVAEAEQLDRG